MLTYATVAFFYFLVWCLFGWGICLTQWIFMAVIRGAKERLLYRETEHADGNETYGSLLRSSLTLKPHVPHEENHHEENHSWCFGLFGGDSHGDHNDQGRSKNQITKIIKQEFYNTRNEFFKNLFPCCKFTVWSEIIDVVMLLQCFFISYQILINLKLGFEKYGTGNSVLLLMFRRCTYS